MRSAMWLLMRRAVGSQRFFCVAWLKGGKGMWMRLIIGAWGFLALFVLGGCDLAKVDAGGDGGAHDTLHDLSTEELEGQISRALHALYPDLSDEEIADLTGSLDLEAVLALRDELEAVRATVVKFSADLFKSAGSHVKERHADLEPRNDGFPEGLAAISSICLYDESGEHAQVSLSGVLNGRQSVQLEKSDITVTVDGEAQEDFTLQCLSNGPTVDIVFLIDITGSMSNVIDAVRDSVVSFIDIIESSGVRGTVSVVSFQDTVGVNRSFQEQAPPNNYERSPFFAPVAIDNARDIDALRSFVNRLEANRGADAPENLSGAIDFARNNVIGLTSNGEPNVIGDGRQDPAGTEPFPALRSDHQVFVALTDVTFHGDDRNERNSSLEAPFIPRNAEDILATLHQTGTVVHVSDPSWSDASLHPSSPDVDADYWAIHTGGVGEDVVLGYSLVDLELVVVAEDTGLLDITLDKILDSSCTLDFDAVLSAGAEVAVTLNVDDATFETQLAIERF